MIFIPIGILIASIVSFVIGNKQWKSGTTVTTMGPNGGPVTRTDSSKRMSWSSIGANVFGIIFLLLAIGVFVWMQIEK